MRMNSYEGSDERELWISLSELERAMNEMRFFDGISGREHEARMERFSALLDDLEMAEEGTITFDAEWEKLSPGDPFMDDTERVMFPDETYRCSRCGSKGYFGITCQKDRFCQHCGARMINAGRRRG
ncbi:MAG: hypothetical protein IJT77_09040 [Clostridia bacterium]|nr:hypothetical protein [Clostridia bacterium]